MTLEIEDADRTADEIDRANMIADAHNQACVDRARQAVKPEQEPDEDGNYAIEQCADCGDDIPEERLRMGKILCVFCQEQRERRGRLYGRQR